jgi:hypothetical protein
MKTIIIFGICVLLWITSSAQNSVALKMNLEKNKVYRLNSISEQTVIQTVNGNPQTVNSRTQYTLSLKMLDTTPQFMVAEARFDTIIVRSNAMGKTTLISSASEGNIASSEAGEIMSAIMNRLSKNALYIKMDYSGKVVEIVNTKMLGDIVLRDSSAITLKGPVAAAIKNQIQGMVSEQSFKTMVEMFTYNLPAKQVTAGDKWNTSQPMNSGGMNLDIVTEYLLDKLSDEKAEIKAVANIKPAANAAPLNSGLATVTYDNLNGLSKSVIVINKSTGLPVEIKTKTQINGNLGVSGPGFSMQIPMEISGETNVTAIQ